MNTEEKIKRCLVRIYELQKVPKGIRTQEQVIELHEHEMELRELKKRATRERNERNAPSVSPELMEQAEQVRLLLADASVFVQHITSSHDVRLHGNGVTYDGEVLSHASFSAKVALANDRLGKLYQDLQWQLRGVRLQPAQSYGQRVLDCGLMEWYRKEHGKRRADLVASIAHDPSASDAPLRRWLEMVTGRVCETQLAVMKHWIQCVKRKVMGLPVEYHIFPILYGRQGNGKTQAVSRLVSPLREYALEYTVDQLSDKTLLGAFETNYVVVLNELAKADKADMNSVKRIVDANTVDGRPPYGRQVEKVRQNCMFIGTSNKPVKEVFVDDEMRRFFEIETVMRYHEDYHLMDELDVMSVWRCVDELDQNRYFNERHKQIRDHQRQLSTQHPVEQWAQDMQVYHEHGRPRYTDAAALYDSYSSYLVHNNFRYDAGNRKSFGQLLSSRLGVQKHQVSVHGRMHTVYAVSQSCGVHGPSDSLYDMLMSGEKFGTLL